MNVDVRDRSTGERLRRWLITGTALLVPLVITVLVLVLVVDFLSGLLQPAVTVVELAPGISPVVEGAVVQLLAVAALVGVVIAVGAVAEFTERSRAKTFHTAIEGIPGVGALYRSFRRMTDVFVESDTDAFQEVKLVEFPTDGSYSLAFVTADTPETIQAAAGEIEMQTLFVPLAPNPVMGGFLVNFAPERVHEVDMTVEEALQSIVTSGVSVETAGKSPARDRAMAAGAVRDMQMDPVDESFDTDDPSPPEDS